jgi:hypothetical protein
VVIIHHHCIIEALFVFIVRVIARHIVNLHGHHKTSKFRGYVRDIASNSSFVLIVLAPSNEWELCFLMWMPPRFDAMQSSSLLRNSLRARVNTPSTQSRNSGPSGPYPIPGIKVIAIVQSES